MNIPSGSPLILISKWFLSFEVGLGGGAHLWIAFDLHLGRQPLFDGRRTGSEPGRVEHLQIEGVELGPVTAVQGVTAQQYRQGAAPLELLDLADDLVQGDFVIKIGVIVNLVDLGEVGFLACL